MDSIEPDAGGGAGVNKLLLWRIEWLWPTPLTQSTKVSMQPNLTVCSEGCTLVHCQCWLSIFYKYHSSVASVYWLACANCSIAAVWQIEMSHRSPEPTMGETSSLSLLFPPSFRCVADLPHSHTVHFHLVHLALLKAVLCALQKSACTIHCIILNYTEECCTDCTVMLHQFQLSASLWVGGAVQKLRSSIVFGINPC